MKRIMKSFLVILLVFSGMSNVNAACTVPAWCKSQCQAGCKNDPNGYSQCYSGCTSSCEECDSSGGGSGGGSETSKYYYYIDIVQTTGGIISTSYSSSLSSTSSSKTIALSNFSNTANSGYEFVRYEYSTNNSTWNSFSTDYKMQGDSHLYVRPVFTPTSYTISYTLNGGTLSGQKTNYNVETIAFTLLTPTRIGYTFLGWTGSNGTTPQTSVTIAKGSTGNKTYIANWKANTNTKFVINQYLQDLNGNYILNSSSNKMGTTDSSIKISDYSNIVNGFTLNKATN